MKMRAFSSSGPPSGELWGIKDKELKEICRSLKE
jgi:hypothetical protein